MRYLLLVLKLLVFILLFAFAMRNAQPVRLDFFADWYWEAPLALLLLLCFVAGVVVSLLATLAQQVRLRRELVNLRRELRKTQSTPPPRADVDPEPPHGVL